MPLQQFGKHSGLLNAHATQELLTNGHVSTLAVKKPYAVRHAHLRTVSSPKAPLIAVAGCTVLLVSMQDELHWRVKLVANPQPDISQGELSEYSPLGQALCGKRIGEQVKLNLPGIKVHFLITDILGGTNVE